MRPLPLLLAALFAGSPLAAQAVLEGRIREDSTGRPLAGVEVIVAGTRLAATTDQAGWYRIGGLPAGRRIVLFRFVGYQPLRTDVLLSSGDTTRANGVMARGEVRLAPIEVVGERPRERGAGLEAFEERRRLGFGKFLDSLALRQNEHLPLVEMLGRLQGVGFTMRDHALVAVSQRRFTNDGQPCYMSVYLDGVPLYTAVAPGISGPKIEGRAPPDLRMFSLSSLAAVELYRGAAEVPVEYGGAGAACGVILLWSRRP